MLGAMLEHAATVLAGSGSITHLAAVAFVSEIGDKSFFLAMILAVWCPIAGIRSDAYGFSAQLLAAAGSLTALIGHAFISWVGLRISSYVDFIVVLMLLGLSAKAWVDMGFADRHAFTSRSKAPHLTPPTGSTPALPAKTTTEDSERPGWISGGFLGDFKAYDPSAYEVAGQGAGDFRPPHAETTAEKNPFADHEAHNDAGYGTSGLSSLAMKDRNAALSDWAFLAAFAVPFVTIFLAESSDKSLLVFREALPGGGFHGDRLLGASIGYSVSVLLASLIGFLMERQFSEPKLLFAITCGFFAMSLVTVSTACLRAEMSAALTSTTVVGVPNPSATNLVATNTSAAAFAAASIPAKAAGLASAAASAVPSLLRQG